MRSYTRSQMLAQIKRRFGIKELSLSSGIEEGKGKVYEICGLHGPLYVETVEDLNRDDEIVSWRVFLHFELFRGGEEY